MLVLYPAREQPGGNLMFEANLLKTILTALLWGLLFWGALYGHEVIREALQRRREKDSKEDRK
ncbi:MAG: hypothetical protein HYS57_01090 [Parcubacteria group bacterium]|nr:hypothetical protein [Parcubacteria group bacterium]